MVPPSFMILVVGAILEGWLMAERPGERKRLLFGPEVSKLVFQHPSGL